MLIIIINSFIIYLKFHLAYISSFKPLLLIAIIRKQISKFGNA